MAAVCTKCGGAVETTGACSTCGYNEQLELEIGAFMAPHINRARITLLVIGVLYVVLGIRAYLQLEELNAAIQRFSRDADVHSAELRRAITLAYVTVIFAIGAGIANIVLAGIAGTKTMLAFNIAAAIFIAHTLVQLYVTDGVILTNFLWWITAIFLGLGYQAAHKAHKLRTGGVASTSL